jgi:hypothetical protein
VLIANTDMVLPPGAKAASGKKIDRMGLADFKEMVRKHGGAKQ